MMDKLEENSFEVENDDKFEEEEVSEGNSKENADLEKEENED